MSPASEIGLPRVFQWIKKTNDLRCFLALLLGLSPSLSFAVWGENPQQEKDPRQLEMATNEEEEEERDENIQYSPPCMSTWYDHEQGTHKNESTMQWGESAPAYLIHCHGANLMGWHDHEGTKTSVVCKQLGYGSFEVVTGGKIQIACQCVDPQCNEAVIPVTSAFNNCKFRIKQLKGNGVKVTTQWQEVGNECLIFDETNNAVPTTRVVIECKKLSEPTEEEDF
jgi:hypothetical protein